MATARAAGAARVGIASRDRLLDAPPSARPDRLLPSTRSAISIALPLDGAIQRAFLAKRDRLAHCRERKALAQRLYALSDRLVELLRGSGHEARGVDVNNVYRSEPGARDVAEMTEFLPDFSHRYAAIAAGVGRLGWSGNLLTPELGAMVELTTVLTSAALEPSPLLEHNPCDRCKLCVAACPVAMIDKRDSVRVTVAGLVEEIARKQPNTRCWIGCTGYHGTSAHERWSNWSPYRLPEPLPTDKGRLDELCIRLQKADPQMLLSSNSFTDYRGAVFDADWFSATVCGHCRGICFRDRPDRQDNLRRLRSSGVVAMTPAGTCSVPTAETEVVATPFGVHAVIVRGTRSRFSRPSRASAVAAHLSPLDAAVLDHLACAG